MAALAETLGDRIARQLEKVRWEVRRREVGRIVRVGDGVAFATGIPSVRYGELLECQSGLFALVFDLRPTEVGMLFLGLGRWGGGGRRSAVDGTGGERPGRRCPVSDG